MESLTIILHYKCSMIFYIPLSSLVNKRKYMRRRFFASPYKKVTFDTVESMFMYSYIAE